MPSTVFVSIQSTIRGFVYGSSGTEGSSVAAQQFHTTFVTTYAGFIARQSVVQVATAQAGAVQINAGVTSAQGYLLIPAATYNGLWNVTASTAQVGVAFQGPSPAIIPSSANLFVYTTAGRSFPLQVIAI